MEYKKLNVNGGGQKLYLHSFYSGSSANIGGFQNTGHFISFWLISPQQEPFGSGQNVVSFLTEKGFTDVKHFAPASGTFRDAEEGTNNHLIGIFASGISLKLVLYYTQTNGLAFNFSQSNMSEYVTEL